jgi:hypothetical protein
MGATVTGLALAAGNPAVPWPYGWYSQPVYPGALLTPGFGLMAQNPYLPQPSAAPQVQPAVPVITWPFFVVPQPQSPVQAPSSAPVAAAKSAPVLSDAAREALAQAEAYAKAARAAFTLWVPAENALSAALQGAKEGDSAAVLKHAQAVSDLTRLGTAQAGYPSTEMPSKATAKKKAKRKPKPKTKPKTKTKKTAVAKPAAAAPQSTGATTRSTPQLSKATVPTANPAPPPEAGARQVRPRKLCWQGDRLEECP